MGSCHRNPSTYKVMPKWWRAHGGCAVDPASLLLAVALLRLVVVPCLNAHKRHVRDPLYSFSSLLVEVAAKTRVPDEKPLRADSIEVDSDLQIPAKTRDLTDSPRTKGVVQDRLTLHETW